MHGDARDFSRRCAALPGDRSDAGSCRCDPHGLERRACVILSFAGTAIFCLMSQFGTRWAVIGRRMKMGFQRVALNWRPVCEFFVMVGGGDDSSQRVVSGRKRKNI